MENNNEYDKRLEEKLKQEQLADEEKKQFSQKLSHAFAAAQTQEHIETLQEVLQARSKNTLYLVIALGVMTALFFTTLIIWSQYPKNRIVATTNAEAICHVTPSDNPNLNDVAISNFAQEAVIHINSFSFADYERKIEWAMANYFNEKGRISATAGIKNLGLLKVVDENLFTIKSTVDGVPSLIDVEKGSNTWRVRVPIRVEVFGATQAPLEVQKVLATVSVSASNASKVNATGLSISAISYERIQ